MAKKSKKVKLDQIDTTLDKFSLEHYSIYGKSVLEDRAIPDFRDGMSPINRRLLYSAFDLGIRSTSKYVKSARIVGDVLGRFHPHSDSSCYGAMVKMTNVGQTINNSCYGLFEGEGNWGNLSNTAAAAMRYTEARLSKFSDEVLFNKFYVPAIKYVPNFDSSTVEPLILPALLPIAFLNGRFGIAPGATCNIPAFSGESIYKVLKAAYSGKALTSKFLSRNLQCVTTFGGLEETTKDEGRTNLFKKTRGSAVLKSSGDYNAKTRTLTFTRFAVEKMQSVLEKLSVIDGIQSVRDMSNTKDRFGRLEVQIKKLDDTKLSKVKEKIDSVLSTKENYVLNFTERYINELGRDAANMSARTLPQVFTSWVEWRIQLERDACLYWIAEDDKEIHRLGLLIQAVSLIDFIVKLLKDRKLKNNNEVFSAYAKKAKVSVDDAKYVLGRPIISLRNMERIELEAKLKEVKKHRAQLKKRHDTPLEFMLKQLKSLKSVLM